MRHLYNKSKHHQNLNNNINKKMKKEKIKKHKYTIQQ